MRGPHPALRATLSRCGGRGTLEPHRAILVNILTDRDLVAGIVQLGNLLTRHLAPVFEKANVTPQQFAVLATIAAEPMSLAAVARTLAVSKQNMTGMMARLESLALIE